MKNWISEEELKEAVSEIKLKEESKRRILKNCREQAAFGRPAIKNWKIAVGVSVLAAVFLCSPAAGQVRESLQTWLSKMTRQEVTELYDGVQKGGAEAISLTRRLSWDEKIRKDQLKARYKKGERFPTGKAVILKPGQKADPERVSYEEVSVTWSLPERELTDEELLEIIDLEEKMNYSLNKINEETGLISAQEQTAPKITEQQALDTAIKLLEASYEITVDPERIFIETYDSGDYAVKYSGLESADGYRENCNLLISGQDGKLEDLIYRDRDYIASCLPAGEFPEVGRWYEKGRKILFALTGESKLKSSCYLFFYSETGSRDSEKKICYVYELENGDTYRFSFIYQNGVLEMILKDESLTENWESYEAKWRENTEQKGQKYKTGPVS